jgi:16S rRNA (uracil1498-N3)-methyltransferase
MTPPLFLLRVPDFDSDWVVLGGEEARHAARVRRIAVGETIWVGNGRGRLAVATVRQVDRAGLGLQLEERWTVPAPDPRVAVVQALPKGERAELAVEILTELGVDEIVPWSAARSIAQWRGEKAVTGVEKWQRTADEAAKQSRRAYIPDVCALAGTTAVVAALAGATTALVLHESATEPLSTVPLPATGDIVLVVGPEGGISDDELERFSAAGARTVRLGRSVLRTSTAGAAALAGLSVRLGRWG